MKEKMVVVKIDDDEIVLSKLEEDFACESCALKNLCNRTDQTVRISKEGIDVRIGDIVEVEFPTAVSTKASGLMYTLPLSMFIVTLMITKTFGASDAISFLSGIAVMGLYYAVLKFLDKRLSEKFRPRIISVERNFSVHLHRNDREF